MSSQAAQGVASAGIDGAEEHAATLALSSMVLDDGAVDGDAADDDNSDEEACCAPTSRKSVSEADMENTRVEHGDEEVRSRTIHPILHRSRQNRFPIIAYVNPLSASTHCRLV